MDFDPDTTSGDSPRTALIGAFTIIAIFAAFVLAILARRQTDVPFVVIAPVGTALSLDGKKPRALPNQPRSSERLVSFYFLTAPGEHQMTFQQPGSAQRTQLVRIEGSRVPVIYTLLRDSLHQMRVPTR